MDAKSDKTKMNASGNDDEQKEASTQGVGVDSLPDEALQLMASFAAPPDVYNLALTCKHFHQPTSNGKLLATRLLRESLLSNLGRVLETTNTGITLDAVLKLAQINGIDKPPQALIAGSTLVQACLGTAWGTDVDVYCSAQSAPAVRSWLVEEAQCVFVGFKDYLIDFADSRLVYTVDTKIHHVEHFGSVKANAEAINDYRDAKMTEQEYYEKAKEWGKNCQWYTDRKWKNPLYPMYKNLGMDVDDPVFEIHPKPGGDFLFDVNGDGDIDLIVAAKKKKAKPVNEGKKAAKKQKTTDEWVTPMEVLEDFDLDICKASFDGKTFRIPEPHLTFQGKTKMEPMRKAVVESYLKHFQPPREYLPTMTEAQFVPMAITAVQKEITLPEDGCSVFHLVDRANEMPEYYVDDEGEDESNGHGPVYDPNVLQAKCAAYIQFHNWTAKLVNRLRKYQARGIEVVDAPEVQIELKEFHLT